jgi:hypothetical protein
MTTLAAQVITGGYKANDQGCISFWLTALPLNLRCEAIFWKLRTLKDLRSKSFIFIELVLGAVLRILYFDFQVRL